MLNINLIQTSKLMGYLVRNNKLNDHGSIVVISSISGYKMAFNFNYAGVLLGDVNGSWSPPAESEILDNSYFIALEGQGLGPADQWFAFPLP